MKGLSNNLRNQFDPQFPPGEVNLRPSKTVPDQALSLQTILDRYVRGQDVVTFKPSYIDHDFVPVDWERMDEMERRDYVKAAKARIVETANDLQNRYDSAVAAAAVAAKDDHIDIVDVGKKPKKEDG